MKYTSRVCKKGERKPIPNRIFKMKWNTNSSLFFSKSLNLKETFSLQQQKNTQWNWKVQQGALILGLCVMSAWPTISVSTSESLWLVKTGGLSEFPHCCVVALFPYMVYQQCICPRAPCSWPRIASKEEEGVDGTAPLVWNEKIHRSFS